MFKNFKLSTKIFGGVIILVTLVFISLYFVVEDSINRLIKIESERVLDNVNKNFLHILQTDINMLAASLDLFLDNEFYKDIFVEKDREKLYSISSPIFERIKSDYGITHFYFHSPEGYNFLRVHNKDIHDDEITRFTFDQAQKNGEMGAGIELGKTAFALRVVKPYYKDEELIGYVEFGEEIDHFLSTLKMESDGDISLFVEKKYLSREKWKSVRNSHNLEDNWDDFGDTIIINSTVSEENLSSDKKIEKCFNSVNSKTIQNQNKPTFISIYENETDSSYMCGGIPVYDAGDRLVGSIMITRDFSDLIGVFEKFQFNFTIILLILFMLGSFIYIIFIHRTIIIPIKSLTILAQEISKGNYNQKILCYSEDEIGRLTKSFNKMTKKLLDIKDNIEQQVKDRTKQLEKANKLMIGRELKMVELKKEIVELKKVLNEIQ